ncbi:efflux RND transporter periplasmic adaptor subunit [Spongorhabdus nitratireducens]
MLYTHTKMGKWLRDSSLISIALGIFTVPAAAKTQAEIEALLEMKTGEIQPTLSTPVAGDQAVMDCLLVPSVEVSVASPVVGVIHSVEVREGDYVRKGQPLIRLHSEVEQASLALKKAQTEFGKRTISRNEELYRRNLISEQEKDEIEINNRIFALEMAQIQAQIDQKTIRSSISGIVTEKLLDQGEYVGEDPIMTVTRLNPLHVELVLPASLFGSVQKGNEISVILADPVGGHHEARVDTVDAVIDAASSTFGVRLVLDNPENRIPAGLKCQADMKL